jgi:predicted O-linked N-acetylglucosamine transferase (SPINDLY family)
VGRNIQPLLAHHDHQQFEVFCYADMRVVDDLTTELTGYADHWCNTVDLSHEALAQKIRSDTIDILVDLNLHLANDRLPVFARRPAPVQVAFAGYPGTTGLRAIDYRLTDPYLDPPGENDDFYSEESIRLPHSFWCYAPREDIGVNELPAATTGIVTFGCLNNFVKVNVPVLQLWGQVLQAVPGSRLLLSAPEGRGRTRALATFEGLGIEPSRVEFVVKTSHRDYLLHYHRIDIMLDTFPYNGHTTSLDALWMGVPVITLAGCHAVARAGLSQLTNVGFPDGIAASPAEYVERARLLAANLKGLAQLRGELRQRMEASPLMDAVGFTRGIESAYQSMWECWRTRN